MSKITVLGAGGWGIALALKALKCGNSVTVWTPFESEVKELNEQRESKKLLPGVVIPEKIVITDDFSYVSGSDITVIATPSFAVRETAAKLKNVDCGIIVNVAKGFEKNTDERLSVAIKNETGRDAVVLSGPSHAEEVARNVPTTVVAASVNDEYAKTVQETFSSDDFRIYTCSDVIGVEVGGAVKNVIAVAAGIINGLKVGDNTRAALITRGLAEIRRIGVAMGADDMTFMGLSGIGDLVVTCMSRHSRNNRFGNMVGEGVSVKEALETVGTVEGFFAVETVCRLANKYGVEMPISEECYNILFKGASPMEAMLRLMQRPYRAE